MRLLPLISWPYVRRHVLRTALTVAGIVLGVAVFVAMHTANQSVLSAFSQTIDRIAGLTELQVTAGEAGFPEEVLETVQSAKSVRIAVPVIEAVAEAELPGLGTLLVLGIDMTGDRSLREYDLDSAEGRVSALRRCVPMVARIKEPMLRDEYARRLAGWVGWADESQVLSRVRDEAQKRGMPERGGRRRAAGNEAAQQRKTRTPEVAARPDPADPTLWPQREALKSALQYPALAGPV